MLGHVLRVSTEGSAYTFNLDRIYYEFSAPAIKINEVSITIIRVKRLLLNSRH